MNQSEFWRLMAHADVLLSQGRYEHAEDILIKLMATGIESTELLTMMAMAKAGLGEYNNAEELLKKAMSLNPNDATLYYLLASIKTTKRKFKDAIGLIDKAIGMDPDRTDFFSLKAFIYIHQKDYKKALASADIALTIDAENIDALNARSAALTRLGRKEEAKVTTEKSLATDPNNSETHANVAWGLLQNGQSKEALTHFMEALKINPMNNHAKSGLSEAMKAKFPLYRYFLVAILWLNRLSGIHKLMILIGFFIVYRVLIFVTERYDTLQPYLYPAIVLLFLLFIGSWIFSPMMNLYMLTNKYGRFILSKNQKNAAKYVGLCLGLSMTMVLIYLAGLKNEGLLSSAILVFLAIIPLGSMDNPSLPENKQKLRNFTRIIILLVIIESMIAIWHGTFTSPMFFIPLISIVLFQWYANYTMIKE